MKILICSSKACFFEFERKIHYSVRKSFEFAKGLFNNGHEVYVLSKDFTDTVSGVRHIRYRDIDERFMLSLDCIFFTIEGHFEKCIDSSQHILNLVKRKAGGENLKPYIIVKTGRQRFLSDTNRGEKFYLKAIDFFILQEKRFADDCARDLLGKSEATISYSMMGTPKNGYTTKSNPYVNHSDKKNILYMGRLRQSPSRMPFLLNIAKKLGSEYLIHILPGTFSKPNGVGRNKFGPENEENYLWLCNYFSIENIIVHKPVDWGDHWDFVYNADVGIDFSPNASKGKYPAGNAKLLEYMSAGLPSVTEITSGNSELVYDSNGGMVVKDIYNEDSYCRAIMHVANHEYNREEISKITREGNSWEKRAAECIDIIEKNKRF